MGRTDSNSQDDSNKRCKVISKLLIPEELMFDILSWLPVHCLLNSARYVCKPWAATIRSPLFAEACLHRARSKPGLYVEHLDSRSSYFLDIKDDVNSQFEFERIDLGTPTGMGRIVSSCDGILLRCCGNRRHFVVNPILKCRLRIPRLSISADCEITLARVPHTTMFKLFFIDVLEVSHAFWYVFYVLRIGIDNSLKEIARKEAPLKPDLLRKPLYCGGNDLYYITMEGITVVDVDKEITVGEYPLPSVEMCCYENVVFLSMGDNLSCIEQKGVRDKKTYEIYILDFDSGKWSLCYEIGPINFAVACGHESIILHVATRLWISDQIIIQVYINKKRDSKTKCIHFSYNVKTRQLKKIEAIAEKWDIRLWLHTNSLVSLPGTST